MKKLLFILAFLGLTPSAAQATQYWVKLTGGTTTTSCVTASGNSDPGAYIRTVQAGLACVGASDTLNVLNGVYPENINWTPSSSGTLANPIHIKGESKADTIIRPTSGRLWQMSVPAGQTRNHIKFSNMTWDGNLNEDRIFTTFNGRFGFITLSGLNIINAGKINNVPGGIAITCGGDGTGSDLGDWIIENSLIHTNTTGIYYQCPRATVRNNEWHTTTRNAILIQSNDLQHPGVHRVERNLVYNTGLANDGHRAIACNQPGIYAHNIVRDNTNWGILCTQFAGGANHAKIFNNTVEGNGSGGIRINPNMLGLEVKNNIVFGNGGTAISDAGTSTVLENNTTTDPSWVNAAAHNFNVTSGSASNGTDLTSQGILDNNLPGRGALDPVEIASAVTLSANQIRLTVSNSFSALRNVSAIGFSCNVGTVTGAVASGNTNIDLTVDATMTDLSTPTCSYTNATGTILNSIGIGNKTDATGNAHLLSFTNFVVVNTLEPGAGDDDPPATAEVGINTETVDTTSHGATVPLNIAAGDLLVAHLSLNGVPTISGMTGWTQVCRQANTNVVGEVYYKIAVGDEIDFTYTSSASEQSITYIFRIPAASWHGTTPPECATATGASTTPDSPSLNPAGWATANNLWFSFFSRFRGDQIITAYPVNYPNDQHNDDTGTFSTTVQMGSASRSLSTEQEDPSPFTVGGSQNWAAFTVTVRPLGEPPVEPGVVVFEQRDVCWKYWQDAESVACSFAQNTQAKAHGFGRIVARVGIGVTGANADPTAFIGEYRINGGAWTVIANSACAAPCIEYVAPRIRSNGEATTRLLDLPVGLIFAAGALQAQAGASAVFDYAQDGWTEFDQSLQFVGLTAGDLVEIRMRHEIGTLLTYTNYATLLVVVDSASMP